MAFSAEIIAKMGFDATGFQAGLAKVQNTLGASTSAMTQQIGGVSRGVENLKKLFMLGGLLTAAKSFFSAAIEHAREYQGEVDQSVEATLRFADRMKQLEVTVAKAGVEVIGWVEKAAFGMSALIYGVDAASDAYLAMDAAAKQALDDKRTNDLQAAKDRLAKVVRDIAFAEADSNGKVNILLQEQVGIRERIKTAGAETVEGLRLAGELAQNEAAIRKIVADINKDEKKTADEKADAEKKVTDELKKQKAERDELISKIRKEKAEIEAKIAAEAAATVKAANAAAGRQGFDKLSPAEEQAMKDWIAGGKQGPAPVKRSGALRDSLGSGGQNESSFLIDGRWYPGRGRPASDFEGASEAALQEFIRRAQRDAAGIRDNFGTGATALVDVVSGGAVRSLAESVINMDIVQAQRRLGEIGRFSGADRSAALRDFQGDPLSFDRLYESSQRTLDAANRTALGIERLVDRIQRPQPVIVTNASDMRPIG